MGLFGRLFRDLRMNSPPIDQFSWVKLLSKQAVRAATNTCMLSVFDSHEADPYSLTLTLVSSADPKKS